MSRPLSFVFLGLVALVILVSGGCVDDRGGTAKNEDVDASIATQALTMRVESSKAESSPPLRALAKMELEVEAPEYDHEVHRIPRAPGQISQSRRDPVAQTTAPSLSMPAKILDFLGQGTNNGAVGGDPPDTVGAVGPNDYVQAVNTHIEVWNKAGTVLKATAVTRSLWTGYTGTNAGNGCSSRNDGDAVVLYDTLADRFIITQFSLPHSSVPGGPSFQCVAVSKTGDPTGAYWLYDFQYAASINDYGKFSVWPDAYYAAFNLFDAASGGSFNYKGDEFCAYDRAKMLAGQTATQQCFLQAYPNEPACPAVQQLAVFGALPASLDGFVKPPAGTPGLFMQFDYSQCSGPYNQLDLWKFHVDWTTPANSTVTGPTVINVADFTPTCFSAVPNPQCVPQPTTVKLDGLDDRLMFRLNYRNFGTHDSLIVNHSVVAGAGSGVRWYEIRTPGTTPTLFQQGTYAPGDTNWRWMGSIAQDMAGGMVLGFTASSGTQRPTIGWTGRLATDGAGTMGQGESLIDVGAGTQGDDYGTNRGRWGDYSAMTVDPTDDCTFWYTSELVNTTGVGTWDTRVATVKYPNCGANDFSISVAPASQNVVKGSTATYTVTTASTKGTPETIRLNIQDLPTGVTGAFVPTSVSAGGTSTLTLTAALGAPSASNVVFTVIGTAPSAVHAATAQVSVVDCTPITQCPAGKNCGLVPDGCGGQFNCGTCTAPQTCGGGGTANVCGCTPITSCPAGKNCGLVPDGCGGQFNCGACTAPQTCGGGGTANVCGCTPITSCPAGKNCGLVPDGCGGQFNCGTCTAPQTCGGSGTANVCGCTPLTTCPAPDNCGTIPDGCGGTVNCGTCTAPQTCGGSGTANVCGCTPLTKCPAPDNCGTIPDGCGGTVNCGTCTAPDTCTANVCGCKPITACPAGKNCGTVPDGCGGQFNCGSCTSPQTCGGGGTANVCGCTPLTKCPAGKDCGTISDGCGGTVTCGTCSGTDTCQGNTCVPAGTDSGTNDSGTTSDSGGPASDSGSSSDSGGATDATADGGNGGGGDSGGCGCRTVAPTRTSPLALSGVLGLGLLGIARRRRKR